MSEWKVVPVEPTDSMLRAGEHWCDRKAAGIDPEAAEDCYTAMLAAAPRPPVVLPPLPGDVTEFDENGPVHMRRVFNFTRDHMQAYARAALAQYGIVDRQEDAA